MKAMLKAIALCSLHVGLYTRHLVGQCEGENEVVLPSGALSGMFKFPRPWP